jgi:SAM-dependent methyltransferase
MTPLEWPKTPEEVARLNDRLASEHSIDDYYERSPAVIRWIQARRLRIIREMVGPCSGMRILEVGSGGGQVLKMFPEAKLTALDVSDVYLDTARKNLVGRDVRFVKGELPSAGFSDESFDRVICTEVLEHTSRPSEILAAMRRVLVPGGVAVITVPVDPLIDRLKAVVRRTPVGWILGDRVNWGGDKYHLHKWWPWQFEGLLEPDFTVVRRASAPTRIMPLHACFSCQRRR